MGNLLVLPAFRLLLFVRFRSARRGTPTRNGDECGEQLSRLPLFAQVTWCVQKGLAKIVWRQADFLIGLRADRVVEHFH